MGSLCSGAGAGWQTAVRLAKPSQGPTCSAVFPSQVLLPQNCSNTSASHLLFGEPGQPHSVDSQVLGLHLPWPQCTHLAGLMRILS